MKNTMITFAVVAGLFLSSCGKDIESLAGTVWKSERGGTESEWYQDELTFSDTEYSYVRRTWHGKTDWGTGTYKFDYPKVILQDMLREGETYVQPTYGTVKKHRMTVDVLTGDIMQTLELKKQ